MKFEIKEEVLKNIKGNKDAILSILIAQGLYNDSLEYTFNEEDKKNIWYFSEVEIIKMYMRKIVKPRLLVTENSIIEKYNENKKYFDDNNILFKDAREMIKNQLTDEVNFGLEEDFVKKMISEMKENVEMTQEDIKYTKGNPEMIKVILLINLVTKHAGATDFYEVEKDNILDIKKNIRLNYYLNKISSENIEVTEEEINAVFENQKADVANLSVVEANNRIGQAIFEQKIAMAKNKYISGIIEKYNLEKELEKYM